MPSWRSSPAKLWPSTYSMTRYCRSPSAPLSKTATMLGWWRAAAARASRPNRATSSRSWVEAALSTLTATVRSSTRSRARYTWPGRSGDAGPGQDHEPAGDRGFDRDDLAPAVRDREADVDRRDQGQRQRIDGRRVQPPEAERRRGLDDAPDHTPQHRCPQRP